MAAPRRRVAAWLGSISLLTSTAAGMNQTAALRALYTATKGQAWGDDANGDEMNTNWMEGEPCSHDWCVG